VICKSLRWWGWWGGGRGGGGDLFMTKAKNEVDAEQDRERFPDVREC
jgi:hypothetical protein